MKFGMRPCRPQRRRNSGMTVMWSGTGAADATRGVIINYSMPVWGSLMA